MITTSRNIHDLAGRLTTGTRYASTATTGTASFTERGISYDKAGGMLALQRYGQNASTAEDNISLTYNGMRLSAVTGTVGGQSINASFTYDDCGRTTYDGVSSLNYAYDQIGALASVSDASSSTTLTTYRHLADGTKYATVSPSGGALIYRGPFTLKVANISASSPSVSFLRAETGSAGAAIIANASGTGAAPYYYVADHIGSIRAIVDAQGNVVERNDYYTYGKRHMTGRTYATLANSQLLFSGKEDLGQALDLASGATIGTSDLRILDFGARHYDPIVPRWTTQDPLAEKYFPINPYAYCAGDPVNFFDPKGLDRVPKAPEELLGTPEYYKWREEVFKERTGNESSYYSVYGYKYANAFKELKESGKLSKQGEKWVDEVMYSLQKALEDHLEALNDRATAFEDEMLEDDLSLREFAFKTHADAYKNIDGEAPLTSLKISDLFQIVNTPEKTDLISREGLTQVWEVGTFIAPKVATTTVVPIPVANPCFIIVNLVINGKI